MNELPPEVPAAVVAPAAVHKATPWQRLTKKLGPFGVVLVMIAKFFAKLKFVLLPVLKFGVPA